MPKLPNIADFRAALNEAKQQIELGNTEVGANLLRQMAHYWEPTSYYAVEGEVLLSDVQQQYHNLYIDTLAQLIPPLISQKNYAQALAYVRVLKQYDPSFEKTYHDLIHLYVLTGSRVNALEKLERRLAAAKRGQGSLVLISGDSGIGKTSLALTGNVWAKAESSIFAIGRCFAQDSTPFLLWQESLTAINNMIGLDFETLPEPFGPAAPAQTLYQLAQIITSRLQTAAAKQPIVLLLDDIHWADPDSLDLLELVTRNLTKCAFVIIATYRSESIRRDHALYQLLPTLQRNRPGESIHLRPLTLEDTHRLVEAYHGPSHFDFAQYLWQRADGSPLFLVELLSDLISQNLLPQDQDGKWLPPDQSVPVPTLLEQVIMLRVTNLGNQAEKFLTFAAVVGDSWRLSIVENLLDWPEDLLLDILERALASRIIVVDDESNERYRFTHGLVREVLYQNLLLRRRKQLHAKIAGFLEQQISPKPAKLAYHYYKAEMWEMAYQYSLDAADAVRYRFASQGALNFYQQALSSLQEATNDPAPEKLISLYEKIGKTHAALNQKMRATEAYTHMAEQAHAANDRHAEGRALIWLAWNQERAYQTKDATETRKKAMNLAEELNDRYLLALNNYNRAVKNLLIGQLAQSQQCLDLAEPHVRSLNKIEILIEILYLRGVISAWTGHYSTAERYHNEGSDYARGEGNDIAYVRSRGWLGLAQIEQGHYTRAKTTLEKGLSQARDLEENQLLQIRITNMMAYLHNEVGDIEQALNFSRQALETTKRDGDYYNIEPACYALLDLATHHLHAGQIDAAKIHIQEFEAISNRTDYVRFRYMNRYQLLMTELALAQSQFDQALNYASTALQEAVSKGMRKNITKCMLFEGQALLRLGQVDKAIARLQQATDLADDIAHGSLRWQTRLRLANAKAIHKQPSDELYEQADSIVEAIASNLIDDRLRQCLLASPLVKELKTKAQIQVVPSQTATQKPPSPTNKYPAGLTRREVEVLRLVAQGMTNRQIAEHLHISVRTVNTHLTNILNKTTSENRTAAATFAIQHGLI